MWSSRAVDFLEVRLDYVIGGGEENSAAGWLAYMQRLLISTANTSTRGILGTLGLPSPVWIDFVAHWTALKAESTHNSGVGDANQGRRVYEFITGGGVGASSLGERLYADEGQHRELLAAWGAAGSSALPTS